MPGEFEVPDGLTELLQDFTVAVLRSKPANLIIFAKEYFDKLAEHEELHAEDQYDDNDEEFEPPSMTKRGMRRNSVAAERYDPAKDGLDDEDDYMTFPKTDEQRRHLMESVRNILIFRALDESQMNRIIDAMSEREVVAGEVIIQEGDEQADYFYVVDKGSFDILVGGKLVHTYTDEGSFGELALMYNTPRAATIKAISDATLWCLDRSMFRKIVLKTAYMKRKLYEEFLGSMPLMQNLDPYEKMNVCDALTTRSYEDGQQIIREGDASDCMYFVEEGEVKIIRKNKEGDKKEVSRLHKGQYFGELGLLSHAPRAADVFSCGSSSCAVLDIVAFERLLGPCMDIMRRNQESYASDMARAFGGPENMDNLRLAHKI